VKEAANDWVVGQRKDEAGRAGEGDFFLLDFFVSCVFGT